MIKYFAKLLSLDANVLRWVLKFNRPYIAKITFNLLLSVIFAFYNIVFAWILKIFVDIATGDSNESIVFVLLIAILSMLINGVAGYIYRMNQTVLANKIAYEVETDVFESLSKAEYSNFEKRHTADYLTRLTNDLSHVTWFLIGTIDNQMQNLLKVVFSYIYLFILSWPVALVIMVIGFILPIANKVFQKRLKLLMKRRQELASENTIFIQEYLEGMLTIRILQLPSYFLNKLRDLMLRVLQMEQKVVRTTVLQSNLSSIIETSMFFVSMSLGAFLAARGYMAAGAMVAFIQLLNWIIWPFTNIANIGIQLQNELIPAQRVYEICHLSVFKVIPESNEDSQNGVAVSFLDVTFAYNDKQPVLHNISLEINENECIGIVGTTGSGKSTLIKLLMGEYRVDQQIKLFGKSINSFSDEDICNIISYVPQDSWLFSTTIYENIHIGNLQATKEDVYIAAQKAHADEFVNKLTDGYMTLIKDKGSNFSGGQRQRIALARSFLKQSKILIFDESTASLDRLTAQRIQATIKEQYRNKTVIIISHRLEIIKQCDRIFFIEGGKIAEKGSHDELMKKNGCYRKMYEGVEHDK